jgi:hypothetical protein
MLTKLCACKLLLANTYLCRYLLFTKLLANYYKLSKCINKDSDRCVLISKYIPFYGDGELPIEFLRLLFLFMYIHT